MKEWKDIALLVSSDSSDSACYQVESKGHLRRLLSWGSQWSSPGEVLVEDTGNGFYLPDIDIVIDYGQLAYCYYLMIAIRQDKDLLKVTSDCQIYYKNKGEKNA